MFLQSSLLFLHPSFNLTLYFFQERLIFPNSFFVIFPISGNRFRTLDLGTHTKMHRIHISSANLCQRFTVQLFRRKLFRFFLQDFLFHLLQRTLDDAPRIIVRFFHNGVFSAAGIFHRLTCHATSHNVCRWIRKAVTATASHCFLDLLHDLVPGLRRTVLTTFSAALAFCVFVRLRWLAAVTILTVFTFFRFIDQSVFFFFFFFRLFLCRRFLYGFL